MFIFIAGCGTVDIPEDTVASNTIVTTTTVPQSASAVTATATTVMATQTSAGYSKLEQLLFDVSMTTGARQLILSFQDDPDQTRRGLVFAYEITDEGFFETVFENIPVVFGRNGLDKEAEGDGRAPSGIFSIPFAFGMTSFDDLPGIEYRLTTGKDYWVDDTGSDDYNTWQTYEGDPESRWKSFERLMIPAYRLAFVIGYNEKREKGLGSAIFFHVWKDENTFTSGCTAASFDDVRSIISWLDGDKYPVIIQGSIGYFFEAHDIDIRKEVLNGSF